MAGRLRMGSKAELWDSMTYLVTITKNSIYSPLRVPNSYFLLLTIFYLLSSIFIAQAVPAQADGSHPADELIKGVEFEQKLNEQLPLALTFRDETGQTVQLADYFGQKPVILVFAYYECPMLCTLVLNGLLTSLNQLTFDVGNQFEIVTVSIDPTETPELAAQK